MSVGALSAEQRQAARSAAWSRLVRRTSPWAAVAALTVLAAVLRFVGIGHQSFWFDEGNTALLVHLSLGKMLGLIPQTESTPPLYYCLAWVWARLFGFGEAGLRSLSALAGVLAVPVVYGASRKLVSPRAAIFAAALIASNPFLIWYSQEARSYELLVLCAALALLAFAQLRAAPSYRAAAAWGVASLLGLLTHYYAIVAIVPQALWLLYEHRRKREVQAAVGFTAVCGAALIPLLLSQNATGRDSWIGHAPLGLRLRQIIPQFLIGTGAPAREVLKLAAIALALVALALLAFRARPEERRPALQVGALALGGFLLTVIFIAAGTDTLITRNIIVLLLPSAITLAAGFAVKSARGVGAAAATGLCVIGVVAAIGVAVDYPLQRPDWRAVAAVLGARPAAGGPRVILIQHYRTLLPLSLYLHHLAFAGSRPLPRVRELDVVSIGAPERGKFCWWGSACNLVPSQMQRSYAIPGFRETWLRHAHQFSIMRLSAPAAATLTAAAISRALRTTRLRRDELLIQH